MGKMHEHVNHELLLALEFVQQTNVNIFLTGKAGTGKTTFLRNLKTSIFKRMIVVAPTGVAAINACGVTIHSFFQLSFGPQIPITFDTSGRRDRETRSSGFDSAQRFSREKINIIRSLDLLIIDEISMVRADVLDAIDVVLRRFKDRNRPFGGVQLLMIGDLQQLSPVVKEEEWDILRPYYENMFFFSSRALKMTHFQSIELKHIYRQSEEKFINLLNKVRNNQVGSDVLTELNSRYLPDFGKENAEGYITLTTHNAQSHTINETKLGLLKAMPYQYEAKVEGDFPEYSYPTDYLLTLKVGAQVMFVKNDTSRDKLYYNGKIGIITEIKDDTIHVQCEGDFEPIPVGKTEWPNYKYSIDHQTKEITENLVGTFTQFPLKLAWAITIHKSQGLTFEKAIIDANAAFAHGQVYVALSRCRTFEGLVLRSKISESSIKSDANVKGFTEEIVQKHPGEKELAAAKIAYQQSLVMEMFDYTTILYRLNYVLKPVRENTPALLPGCVQSISSLGNVIKEELVPVAVKFNVQLRHMFTHDPRVEGNEEVQQRIIQAGKWFGEKMEKQVCLVIHSLEIETDNSALRKSLKEALSNLYQEVYIRTECYKACQQGFNVKKYCEVKAKASIEKLQLKAEVKKYSPAEPSTGESHPLLLKTLKIWRNVLAEKMSVPVYRVIPQKTLYDIVDTLPRNTADLKKIKGMGKVKMEQFGETILGIIENYLAIKKNETIDNS